ncbi:hypothetical protein QPK24_15695 [Paenibacillus polygoni]|uniref:PIN domain-containing protein n=1 Tax=Paenibacillus polygoni TaxID=3050112 RepID=A0ABY8WXM2_9BACL|nr:hypothetical protein [Paenibacillus polygoni]WIV17850.1 hypothetical protein QPK24_15695 [Paenibacillus polygoni]
MELASFLKSVGNSFFAFMWPRIKNSKSIRDIKAKWQADNYASKTTLLFEAAVLDAKEIFDLPDILVRELLEDKTNRDEVFRWILEGVSLKDFDKHRLNLEPYWESYPRYQDRLVPFFESILAETAEYKKIHWDPEFLEILYGIERLEQKVENGLERIEEKQNQTIQLTESIFKEFTTPTNVDDLNELINQGKTSTARELAKERLSRQRLNRQDILGLHSLIANSYIISGNEKEAIPHLYTAVGNCDDNALKNRLTALIELFEERFDDALKKINEAIEVEGNTKKNLELLINIHLMQKEYDEALRIIDEHQEVSLVKLKANVLQRTQNYDEAIRLAEKHLVEEPSSIDWSIIKAESMILKMEESNLEHEKLDPKFVLDNVMSLLNEILKRDIENILITNRVKELQAALLFRNKRFSEARVLYEDIYRVSMNELHLKNLIAVCMCNADWIRVIELLTEVLDSGSTNKAYIIDLARSYIEIGETEKATDLVQDKRNLFLTEEKLDYEYFITYIDALLLDLKHNDVRTLIITLENTTSDTSHLNMVKGYYEGKLHNWSKAIDHFESCVEVLEGNELIDAKVQLTLAYLNRCEREDYVKLINLIESIPNWMEFEFLINRYVKALYEIESYEKIITLSTRLSHINSYFLEIITNIYFNLGWYDTAKKNYLSLYRQTDALGYHLGYANCLLRLGETEEALEVLGTVETRVMRSGKKEDFYLLSIAYMNALEHRKSMEHAYHAFIAGKEEPETWHFYFGQMSQLLQFVKDPDNKWLSEYQMMFEQFEIQFPDAAPLFKKFDIIEDDNISESFIEELKLLSQSHLQTMNMYENNRLPISVLVNQLQRGPFRTWSNVINERGLHIWASSGMFIDLDLGRNLATESKDVLCDITVLFALNNLNLLEIIKENFNLFVHYDQFMLALQEYNDIKLVSDEGLKTMGFKDGKILVEEFSSLEVEYVVKRHEDMIKWIKENCNLVGDAITNDPEVRKDEIGFINNPIKISKQNNLRMLTDSFLVVKHARDNYKVDCFTIIDFIFALLDKGKIDKARQCELLGDLMIMGYTLIPVKSDVFIHYLSKNNYNIDNETALVFDYLEIKEFNTEFVIDVLSDILFWIWTEESCKHKREPITDYLCSILTTNKTKYDSIQKLIQHSKSKFSILVLHQWERMRHNIEQWLQSQSII